MPKPVRADRRELRLPDVAGGNPTVDVFFDEHRVWSTKLPDPVGRNRVRRIPWPDALTPYLQGRSTVRVRTSATSQELASGEVNFGGPGRVAIIDTQGRWLAMMRTAPALVLVWTSQAAYLDRYAQLDKGWTERDPERWSAPYWFVDGGMAALAMLLTATDVGLGACFFGVPAPRIAAVREAFGVPAEQLSVGVVSLGYAAAGAAPGSPGRRSRRGPEELIHHGSW